MQFNLQPSNDITSNQRFDTPDDKIHDRYDPDNFPVPILDRTCISRRNHVNAPDTDQRPVEGEAPHGMCIVEIVSLRSVDRKGPVERRERWWRV